jgi:hypothetical protein
VISTFYPTFRPTLQPFSFPTSSPTYHHPSFGPTFSPSFIRTFSPSFVPTSQPTHAVVANLVFKANLTLNNVNITSSFTEIGGVREEVLSLPSRDKLAIENTTAISLHVPLPYVKVSGVKLVNVDATVSSFAYYKQRERAMSVISSANSLISPSTEFQSSFRRTLSSSFSPFFVSTFFSHSLSRKKPPSSLSSSRKRIVVLLIISSPVTSVTNTTSLYQQLKNSFVTAVSKGNFTKTLQLVSSSLGSSSFHQCNSSTVSISSPVIVAIPSSSTFSSNDDSHFIFTVPVIIGISLAGTALCLCMSGFCYYCSIKKPTFFSAPCCGTTALYSRTETKETNGRNIASDERRKDEVSQRRKGPVIGSRYDYVLRKEERSLASPKFTDPFTSVPSAPSAPSAGSPSSGYQMMSCNSISPVEVIEIELRSFETSDPVQQVSLASPSPSFHVITNRNSSDYSLRKVSDFRKSRHLMSSNPPTEINAKQLLHQQLSSSRLSSPPPSPLNRSESFKDRYSPKTKQQQQSKLKIINEKELQERAARNETVKESGSARMEECGSKFKRSSEKQAINRKEVDQILL